MKNSQHLVRNSDTDLSASLPTLEAETQPSAPAAQTNPSAAADPLQIRPDASLDIALSTNLRDHTTPSAVVQPLPKSGSSEVAAVFSRQDVLTRFVNWVAGLIKKLERRLLQRLQEIPLLAKIFVVAPKEAPEEDNEELKAD